MPSPISIPPSGWGLVTVLAVALGAAVGAPCRHLLDRAVQGRHGRPVPWGLLVVNLLGSLVLGLVDGVAAHRHVPVAILAGLATGWCGAFTTWSSFGYESVELARRGRVPLSAVVTLGGVVLGVLAAALGVAAGTALP